jgi:hypothetical protein
MQRNKFAEQLRRARAQRVADARAIDEAARRVGLAEQLDESEALAAEEGQGGEARGTVGASIATAVAMRALRDAIAASNQRRRFLWASCAEALGIIEQSLDEELRAILSASIALDEEAEAADAERAEGETRARGGEPEKSDTAEAEVQEGLRICRQRLVALRERARRADADSQTRPPFERPRWKFGRPRPLEGGDGE